MRLTKIHHKCFCKVELERYTIRNRILVRRRVDGTQFRIIWRWWVGGIRWLLESLDCSGLHLPLWVTLLDHHYTWLLCKRSDIQRQYPRSWFPNTSCLTHFSAKISFIADARCEEKVGPFLFEALVAQGNERREPLCLPFTTLASRNFPR